MKIAVLGGGSWGTTMASHLVERGHDVALWEFNARQVEEMKTKRQLAFLPDLKIPAKLLITAQMAEALQGAEVIFSIVPSQFVRGTWKEAKKYLSPQLQWVASLSKGIETSTLYLMSQVIVDEAPVLKNKVVVVCGPSHAEEVARAIPTAVIAACEDKVLAEKAQSVLASSSFRVYTHPDAEGAEICGALKNVFAIACGACDGLGYGDNTKAALLTRGLHEMAKIGQAWGAKVETFYGLAGMGDLVVTCLSRHSRNRLLGEKIAQGKTAEQALAEMTMVAEGYPTAKSAQAWVEKKKLDCPIITEIYRVLYEGKDVKQSIHDLLARPPHSESSQIPWPH